MRALVAVGCGALLACIADLSKLCDHCPNDGRVFADGGGISQPVENTIGAACQARSDCSAGALAQSCYPERLADGGESGYPGGICFRGCADAGDPVCGTGGFRLHYLGGQAECVGQCAEPLQGQGSCRAGYVCDGELRDGGGRGFCETDCRNPGSGCPSGWSCGDAGYCTR